MERQSPFAEVMHWKRLIGIRLIAGGAAATGAVELFGGEIFNSADLIPEIIGAAAIIAGLVFFFSADPARL